MDNKGQLGINLVKKKGGDSLDTFIHWAITGGRFLVILTETIALGAFLYRFSLDRQIVDFSDRIKAQQVVVESSSADEKTYRILLEKLKNASAINKIGPYAPSLFTKITELTDNPITFTTLFMSGDKISITVSAPDVATLKTYVSSLQDVKELTDVSIDRIDNKTETADLDAVISASIELPKANAEDSIPPKEN